ncbi:MAG: hypothetical protein HYT78_16900 [Deltaproteobacteria bacterium]|nr:hypothetical protein [Deltaproteobacteria bacterium]
MGVDQSRQRDQTPTVDHTVEGTRWRAIGRPNISQAVPLDHQAAVFNHLMMVIQGDHKRVLDQQSHEQRQTIQ